MSIIKSLRKLFLQPDAALRKILRSCSPWIKRDKLYLSTMYFLSHGSILNWKNPKTFNEKQNWLKLWSKDKGFEKYVDKYDVRQYVKETIGEEYLIPSLGIWNTVDDINFNNMPSQYVLKTTHDSGGVVIVNNQKPTEEQISFLKTHLKTNYFLREREYPYKDVHGRIIAEKFLQDSHGGEVRDYKFFCFNGKPRLLFIASDRFKSADEKPKFDYFDMELNHLNMRSKGHKNNETLKHITIPNFEEMKELAARLSHGFPFVRIDFYNVNGKIYFGEITFFHDAGIVPMIPDNWNKLLGDWILLPNNE